MAGKPGYLEAVLHKYDKVWKENVILMCVPKKWYTRDFNEQSIFISLGHKKYNRKILWDATTFRKYLWRIAYLYELFIFENINCFDRTEVLLLGAVAGTVLCITKKILLRSKVVLFLYRVEDGKQSWRLQFPSILPWLSPLSNSIGKLFF